MENRFQTYKEYVAELQRFPYDPHQAIEDPDTLAQLDQIYYELQQRDQS